MIAEYPTAGAPPKKASATSRWFANVATVTGRIMGHPLAFVINVGLILIWALSGPIFGYSDTWQLVINTGTTVFTYLLLFIIQNTQNRNTAALHLKLDELLRSSPQARTELALAHLEDAPDEVIIAEQARLHRLAERAMRHTEQPGNP